MEIAATQKKEEFGYDYVMAELDKAKKDGRVFWRQYPNLVSSENSETFLKMLQKAREMGAEIPEWNYGSEHFDAYWNIPAMRKFFNESGAKNLDTPFRIWYISLAVPLKQPIKPLVVNGSIPWCCWMLGLATQKDSSILSVFLGCFNGIVLDFVSEKS